MSSTFSGESSAVFTCSEYLTGINQLRFKLSYLSECFASQQEGPEGPDDKRGLTVSGTI